MRPWTIIRFEKWKWEPARQKGITCSRQLGDNLMEMGWRWAPSIQNALTSVIELAARALALMHFYCSQRNSWSLKTGENSIKTPLHQASSL